MMQTDTEQDPAWPEEPADHLALLEEACQDALTAWYSGAYIDVAEQGRLCTAAMNLMNALRAAR